MTTLRYLVVTLFLSITLFGCKKDDETPTVSSRTQLLVANNWRLPVVGGVTTPDGQSINTSRLNLATQVLFQLDMQFRNNNTVRALDRTSNQVINGGTWQLATDSQSMDVDVTGFKGNFPIVELSRTKLVLRQRAPVDGKDADINLVFEPTI